MKPIVLWIIALAFFMQMLDGTILNTALPAIAQSLGEDPLNIQAVIVAYILTVAFFIPISGWLADYFGTRRVFLGAIAIFTLGSMFCSFSGSLLELVLARIFQGVGGALMVPVGRLAVIKLVPSRQLVKALSFVTMPAMIGPVIGPTLGGVLVEYLSWHWIFLINIPIGIAGLVLSWRFMPDVKDDKVTKFDKPGFIMFAVFVLLFSLALDDSEGMGITALQKLMMMSMSLLFAVMYYWHAKRSSNPIFKPRLLHYRSFRIGLAGNMLSRLSMGALPFLMPLFFQVALGWSALKTGMMLFVLGAMSIIGKMAIDRILNFFGYRRFLLLNTVLIGLAIMSFTFIGKDTHEIFILLLLAVIGTVNSLQFTALTTITMIELPRHHYSQGNSLLSVVMQLALGAGVSIGAIILSLFAGTKSRESTPELLHSFHMTFLVVGMISILASAVFLLLDKDAGKNLREDV